MMAVYNSSRQSFPNHFITATSFPQNPFKASTYYDDYNNYYNNNYTFLQPNNSFNSVAYIESTPAINPADQSQPLVLIPVSGQIVLSLFYCIVGVVAVGANALVVALIVTTRRLRTNTNMFLASQVSMVG